MLSKKVNAQLSCDSSLLAPAEYLLAQDLLRRPDGRLSVVAVVVAVAAGVDPLLERVDDVLLALLVAEVVDGGGLVEGDHVGRLRLGGHHDGRGVADEAAPLRPHVTLLRVRVHMLHQLMIAH